MRPYKCVCVLHHMLSSANCICVCARVCACVRSSETCTSACLMSLAFMRTVCRSEEYRRDVLFEELTRQIEAMDRIPNGGHSSSPPHTYPPYIMGDILATQAHGGDMRDEFGDYVSLAL